MSVCVCALNTERGVRWEFDQQQMLQNSKKQKWKKVTGNCEWLGCPRFFWKISDQILIYLQTLYQCSWHLQIKRGWFLLSFQARRRCPRHALPPHVFLLHPNNNDNNAPLDPISKRQKWKVWLEILNDHRSYIFINLSMFNLLKIEYFLNYSLFTSYILVI